MPWKTVSLQLRLCLAIDSKRIIICILSNACHSNLYVFFQQELNSTKNKIENIVSLYTNYSYIYFTYSFHTIIEHYSVPLTNEQTHDAYIIQPVVNNINMLIINLYFTILSALFVHITACEKLHKSELIMLKSILCKFISYQITYALLLFIT